MKRNVFYVVLLSVLFLSGICLLYIEQRNGTEVLSGGFVEGKQLGFIHALYERDEIMVISFDDAVWLSGKAGEDAAIRAGVCTEAIRTECLPNDYFILNEIKSDVSLILDSNIQIFMKTWEAGEQGIIDKEISLTDFALLINDQKAHWKQLPYTITTTKEGIIRIEEVYIP
jgi:hypothetical protein